MNEQSTVEAAAAAACRSVRTLNSELAWARANFKRVSSSCELYDNSLAAAAAAWPASTKLAQSSIDAAAAWLERDKFEFVIISLCAFKLLWAQPFEQNQKRLSTRLLWANRKFKQSPPLLFHDDDDAKLMEPTDNNNNNKEQT